MHMHTPRTGAPSALSGILRRFVRSRRGGVALPFALTALPLTLLSLAAVDFNRASMVKSGLQDALDAATLTVGRSSTYTADQVQSLGASTLAANLKAFPDTTLQSSTFTLDGNKVVAQAEVSVTPIVADMFGGGNLQVGAHSEVVRAVNKLEIAMVLDNTGSMAGTKLSTLKTAASNFVDTLSAAAARSSDPDAVKISLVPFSMTVNVGTAYRNATWIDQNAASPINDAIFSSHANRFTLLSQMGQSWGGCVESRQAPYDVQETAPDVNTPATLFTPFFAPDEPDTYGYYNSYLSDGTSSSSWQTRQGNVAKYTGSPTRTGANAVGYQYGPNAGCALQPLMRLTTDWSSLKTAINGMTAVGDTNIPMGLVWGWHALSPNTPFADGKAYGTDKLTKVVVLMTDGQNQETASGNSDDSFYSGLGYIWQNRLGITSGTTSQRQAALDARETAVCTNMKAKGIVIYTVRVEVNDTNYGTLKSCASTPDKFYDVKSASDLNAVFNAIAGAIQNLRISH